jgi:endonuclease-3
MAETRRPRPPRRALSRRGSAATSSPARRARARPAARRTRESDQAAAERGAQILDRLEQAHPEATCALSHRNAYELAMATILSAQCTDQRVNLVTPTLFARYPTPADLAVALTADVELIIRSTGFFRAKARSLTQCAQAIVRDHGGRVPADMDALVRLPGIGRKTANVVRGHAFDVPAAGIACDTHVLRVAERLGLSTGDDPLAVERRLMTLLPQARWTRTSDLLIFHGRKVCDARRPACERCPVFDLCRWPERQAVALGAAAGPARRRRKTGGA